MNSSPIASYQSSRAVRFSVEQGCKIFEYRTVNGNNRTISTIIFPSRNYSQQDTQTDRNLLGSFFLWMDTVCTTLLETQENITLEAQQKKSFVI